MRLLTSGSDDRFHVGPDLFKEIPRYIILSHVWARDHSDEVTFQDVEARLDLTVKPEYRKLAFCRDQSAREIAGVQHYWIDTCCIDKRSQPETSEAINSMYRWYQESYKCYVYLPDVSHPITLIEDGANQDEWKVAFRQSRWFKRGWTLQELIAPKEVEFFSVEGMFLGDKRTLEHLLHEITSIPKDVLRGTRSPSSYSTKQRLAWADGRDTTREEDAAYSMLGLFGVHLPPIYGEGRQEAFNRLMDEVRKVTSRGKPNHSMGLQNGHADASRTALSLVSPQNVFPFSRDPSFVGRDLIMKEIDHQLDQYKAVSLVGLGGIGKSQIAIEYAHRALENDPALQVFWVHVGDIHRAKASFRDIANALGLPLVSSTANSVFQIVHQHLSLQHTSPWLLILDNLDDGTVLEEPIDEQQAMVGEQTRAFRVFGSFIPTSPTGKTLLTSRNWKASSLLLDTLGSRSKSCLISIPPMTEDDARELITSRLDDGTVKEDRNEISMLAQDLEFLPLAMSHACSYIIQRMSSVADYRKKYHQSEAEQAELLQYEVNNSTLDPNSRPPVLVTWNVTFQHIRAAYPASATLLGVMSMFSNQMLPKRLLEMSVDPQQSFHETMLPLLQYHLVSERPDQDLYDLHRIVHLATRTFVGNEKINAQGRALTALRKYLPPIEIENFSTLALASPHAFELFKTDFDAPEERLELAAVLSEMSRYWRLASLLAQSEEAIGRAGKIRQDIWGEDIYLTIEAKARHAQLLLDLGRGEESEALARSTLDRFAKLSIFHDKTNTDVGYFVLSMYSTLGNALTYLGRYKDAEDVLERGLSWFAAIENPGDVIWLAKMSLVVCYTRQSAYESAERLCREVIKEMDESNEPVDFAQRLFHYIFRIILARIYSSTLRLDEAAVLFQESYDFLKESYGSGYHLCFLIKLELLQLEVRKGRFDQVLESIDPMIEYATRVYGEEHQHSLTALTLRVEALRQMGRSSEGVELHVHLLNIRRKVFGDKHPETLGACQMVAYAYIATGQTAKGFKLYEELIQAAQETFGSDHADTCEYILQYGTTLLMSGRLDEARRYLEQVLSLTGKSDDLRRCKIREQSYLNLGNYWFEVQQYKEASRYYDLALHSVDIVFDNEIRMRCMIRWWRAFALEKLGQEDKAMKIYRDVLQEAQARASQDKFLVIEAKEALARHALRTRKYVEAQALYEELVEADYGSKLEHRLNTRSDFSLLLRHRGLVVEAEANDRKLLQDRRELFPDDLKAIYQTMNNLGATLRQKGSYDEANLWVSQAATGLTDLLGPIHKTTVIAKMDLVEVFALQKDWSRCDKAFDEVVESLSDEFGPQHFRCLSVHQSMLAVWMNGGRYDKVAALESTLVDSFTKCFGADHEETLLVMGRVAEALTKLGRLEPSKNLFARLYASSAPPKVLGAKESFYAKYKAVLTQLSDTETLRSFAHKLSEECVNSSSTEGNSFAYSTFTLVNSLRDQNRWHECLAAQEERLVRASSNGVASSIFTTEFDTYLSVATNHWQLTPQIEAVIVKYLDMLMALTDPTVWVSNVIWTAAYTLWHHSHPRTLEAFEWLRQHEELLSKYSQEQRSDLRMYYVASMRTVGKIERSVAFAEELLSEPEFSMDQKTAKSLRFWSDYAMSLSEAGRIEEALLLGFEAYQGRRDLLGTSNLFTRYSKINYSLNLRRCGRYSEARQVVEEVIAELQKVTGEEPYLTFDAENQLIAVQLALGLTSDALKLAQVSWSDDLKKPGPKLRVRLDRKAFLAQGKSAMGKHLEAKILAENVMRQRQRLLGATHLHTISSMHDVASIQLRLRKPKEAEKMAVQALALMETEYSNDYLLSLQLRQVLGRAFSDQGRLGRAEHQLRLALYRQHAILDEAHPVLAQSLREYVLFLVQCWRRRSTVAMR